MPQPLLKIHNLGKSYGSKTIFKDISFEIYEGEVLSLLGVNGAGKSSLAAVLASLHVPSGGEILWENQSIFASLARFRQFVGYCPQDQTLEAQLTLRQILQFQGKFYGLRKSEIVSTVARLIDQFQLLNYADSSPDLLSGGFKQRFCIAKTLMHRPKFLILDEPTVSLDALARESLWKNMMELKSRGMTILFTTHYLHEAEKYADRVCVMHEGRLHLIDTPTNLKQRWQKEDLESAFLQLLSGENSWASNGNALAR